MSVPPGTGGAYFYAQQQQHPAPYNTTSSAQQYVPQAQYYAQAQQYVGAPYGGTPGAVGGGHPEGNYASSWVGSSAKGPAAEWQQQRDFVNRRYKALHSQLKPPPQGQQSTPPTDSLNNNPWLGVSDMECLLVSCCQSDGSAKASSSASAPEQEPCSQPSHFVDEDDAPPPIRGALDGKFVLRFLTVVALHCHDLASRSLALAILERSLEQDRAEVAADEDRRAMEAEVQLWIDDAVDHESSSKSPPDEKEPPAKRKKEMSEEESDGGKVVGGKMRTNRRGRRIHRFLASGGLRILHQWLIDASTPVEKPVAASSTPVAAMAAGRQRPYPTVTQASPTGPLLLPLLEFLSSMPFDKNLIKKSKINKQIRSLSKDVDSLASDPTVGANATHVDCGGLPIRSVKEKVDKLKETWEEQAKVGASNKELFANPLDSIQQTLLERLRVLESFGDGKDNTDKEKPEWLKKVEEQQRIKGKKKASKASKGSTADLARRERANERAFLMKEDLQKAQEQRRLLVIKLRELKQKNMQEEQMARHSKNKRSIRWKDGEGPASTFKKRELLEEVFIIPDRNVGGDDAEEEDEEEDDDGNIAGEEKVISLLDDDTDEDMFE